VTIEDPQQLNGFAETSNAFKVWVWVWVWVWVGVGERERERERKS
jgi:hypothetical protein